MKEFWGQFLVNIFRGPHPNICDLYYTILPYCACIRTNCTLVLYIDKCKGFSISNHTVPIAMKLHFCTLNSSSRGIGPPMIWLLSFSTWSGTVHAVSPYTICLCYCLICMGSIVPIPQQMVHFTSHEYAHVHSHPYMDTFTCKRATKGNALTTKGIKKGFISWLTMYTHINIHTILLHSHIPHQHCSSDIGDTPWNGMELSHRPYFIT